MTGTGSRLAIVASGVGRRFARSWALAHLDLSVPFGSSLWLRGANGAGKTTLLRLLAGLSTPTLGQLLIAGHDASREREAVRAVVALVSHALYLYPGLTARETLLLWMRLGSDGGVDPAQCEQLLTEVGLTAAADRRVGQFSAGMRKRLALARARLERPRILLLDEPFSSLDAEGCDLVARWVRDFVADGGTVILASHDSERSAPLCERVVDLEAGQLVADSGLPAVGGVR